MFKQEDNTGLVKMKIVALRKEDEPLSASSEDSIELQLNPGNIYRSLKVNFQKHEDIGNQNNPKIDFFNKSPEVLKFSFIVDATGEFDWKGNHEFELKQFVDQFLHVTYNYKGDMHEPSPVRIFYGDLDFQGRLENLDIHYSMFDFSGKARRGSFDVVFESSKGVVEQAKEKGHNSPDMTHVKFVGENRTIFDLSNEIYGSINYAYQVAKFNGLKSILGTKGNLVFPPLRSFE